MLKKIKLYIAGAVQQIQQTAAEFPRARVGKIASSPQQLSIKGICGCFLSPRTAPLSGGGGTAFQKFATAYVSFLAT